MTKMVKDQHCIGHHHLYLHRHDDHDDDDDGDDDDDDDDDFVQVVTRPSSVGGSQIDLKSTQRRAA